MNTLSNGAYCRQHNLFNCPHSHDGAIVNPLGEAIHSDKAEPAPASPPAKKEPLTIARVVLVAVCSDGELRTVRMTDSAAQKTLNYVAKRQGQVVLNPTPLVMLKKLPRAGHEENVQPRKEDGAGSPTSNVQRPTRKWYGALSSRILQALGRLIFKARQGVAVFAVLLLLGAARADLPNVPMEAKFWHNTGFNSASGFPPCNHPNPPEQGIPTEFRDNGTQSFLPQAGFYFDFPFIPGGQPEHGVVKYVLANYTPPAPPKALRMVFRVDSTPGTVWQSHDPSDSPPMRVRPMFRVVCTNHINEPHAIPYAYRRWWLRDPLSYTLGSADGTIVIFEIPMTGEYWWSVYGATGTQVPEWFEQAKAAMIQTGFSFGGQSFFGHGAGLSSGAARFTLLEYQYLFERTDDGP